MSRLISIILLLACASIANAQFVSGHALKNWWQAYQHDPPGQFESGSLAGYIVGIFDYQVATNPVICADSSVSGDDMMRVVGKWLERHPDDLDKPGQILVTNALINAWPCAGDLADK